MDAVGDQGHKRQFLAGEHPMEDVVVAREEMGAQGPSRARLAQPKKTGLFDAAFSRLWGLSPRGLIAEWMEAFPDFSRMIADIHGIATGKSRR